MFSRRMERRSRSLMVAWRTPTRFASSVCVRPRRFRSSRMRNRTGDMGLNIGAAGCSRHIRSRRIYALSVYFLMALRRCAWCGKSLGSGPGPEDTETHGVCEGCEARLDADAALGHALVGLRAITAGLERARAGIWEAIKDGG